MEYKIEWRGNEHTNKSNRRGYMPCIIVNHVVDGSAVSCDSWFRSPNNNISSAHFLVTKTGEIKQYVKIEDNAWANGLSLNNLHRATAGIVNIMGVNPNWYSVSIEHEGHTGELTTAQLNASIWLHQYIQLYIFDTWGHTLAFNRQDILGHHEIDPVTRPYCPGAKFPWDKLIFELNKQAHWGNKFIENMKEIGLISGEHGGDDTVTWAEFAKVVIGLLKKVDKV